MWRAGTCAQAHQARRNRLAGALSLRASEIVGGALNNKGSQLTDPVCHGPGMHRDGVYFSQVGS